MTLLRQRVMITRRQMGCLHSSTYMSITGEEAATVTTKGVLKVSKGVLFLFLPIELRTFKLTKVDEHPMLDPYAYIN